MGTIEVLILTFVLNALWQVPAVLLACGLGDRLLRQAPARLRHALWIAALLACVLLPAASLLRPDTGPSVLGQEASSAPSPTAQATEGSAWLDSGEGNPALIPVAAASWVAALYGLSFLLHGRGLARAWRAARRLAVGAHPLEIPPALAPAVARCRAALGVRDAEILGSPEVTGPVTVGARHPVILLPARFLASASAAEIVSALGHELAHVRRRDYAIHFCSEVLVLFIAFHPAARLLRRRLAETREMACDEAAVETLVGPAVYARSLLSLAAGVAGLPRLSSTLGVLDAQTLEVRMRRILDGGPRIGARRARASLGAALLLLGGIAAASSALAVRAVASEPAAASLKPFIGTWSGDWPPGMPPGTNPRRALDLEVLPSGEVVEVWYAYEKAPDGSLKVVDKARRPALSFTVSGRTLTFTTQVEAKFRENQPPVRAEIVASMELQREGDALFRIVSHSYFDGARKRGEPVPPPPPPFPMKRIS